MDSKSERFGNNMKKKTGAVALGIFMALLFVGCGSAKVPETCEETSLVIDKERKVTFCLVEEFEEPYYDKDELEDFAAEDVYEFNKEHASDVGHAPISLKKVEILNGDLPKVSVVYEYDSCETYTEHTGNVLFYGEISEAVKQGYSLDMVMKSAKNGEKITKETLLSNPAKYILIADEDCLLYLPKGVKAVSENVVVKENGTVDASEADGMYAVLFK